MKERAIFRRKFTELTGCLHVHTRYSYDSETPLKQILKAANQRKLDYIGINDHQSNLCASDEALQSESRLKVITGFEINDPDNNNHLLVYGNSVVLSDKSAREYVTYYAKAAASTFAAHPFERRATRYIRKYVWTDTDIDEFSGLEIWNALSNWVSRVRPGLNGILWVILAKNFIRRPSRRAITWWDQLNCAGKRRSAIGSVDAHGLIIKKLGIKITFLKHKFMFNSVRTNVLLPEGWQHDTASILRALREGRSYIINYHRGIPYNFYAGIAARDEEGVSFGKEISYKEGLYFYYHLSKIARVKLYCNGEKCEQQLDEKGRFQIKKPGNYRLEILLNRKGWIYTNNIYVI